MRKTQFQTEEYYHIFNRDIDRLNIFINNFDFTRFIKSLREFNAVEPIGSLYKKAY